MVCWNGSVVQPTCNPLTLVRLNIDCLYFYLYCPVMIILVYSWSFLSILVYSWSFLSILDHSCLFLIIFVYSWSVLSFLENSCVLRCILDYFSWFLIILVNTQLEFIVFKVSSQMALLIKRSVFLGVKFAPISFKPSLLYKEQLFLAWPF